MAAGTAARRTAGGMPRSLESIREALVSSKQRLRAMAAALLLGLSLMSMGAPARADDILDRGFGSSPDTLDPQLNFGAREGWIQDDMYEGLVVIDNVGKIVPGSAESWDVADDGKTWTFHLRSG
jgi:oligopeptide transport system substrate-binding protein